MCWTPYFMASLMRRDTSDVGPSASWRELPKILQWSDEREGKRQRNACISQSGRGAALTPDIRSDALETVNANNSRRRIALLQLFSTLLQQRAERINAYTIVLTAWLTRTPPVHETGNESGIQAIYSGETSYACVRHALWNNHKADRQAGNEVAFEVPFEVVGEQPIQTRQSGAKPLPCGEGCGVPTASRKKTDREMNMVLECAGWRRDQRDRFNRTQ